MTIEITFEKQTHEGLLRNTKRVWTATNGHLVVVKTIQQITSKGSWSGYANCFANVTYVCECGRTATHSGNPKKAELANHDKWLTPEQVNHIVKMINKEGN